MKKTVKTKGKTISIRGRSKTKKIRRCSACGAVGHNARTCNA